MRVPTDSLALQHPFLCRDDNFLGPIFDCFQTGSKIFSLVSHDSLGVLVLGHDWPCLWVTLGLRNCTPLPLQRKRRPSRDYMYHNSQHLKGQLGAYVLGWVIKLSTKGRKSYSGPTCTEEDTAECCGFPSTILVCFPVAGEPKEGKSCGSKTKSETWSFPLLIGAAPLFTFNRRVVMVKVVVTVLVVAITMVIVLVIVMVYGSLSWS